MQKDGFTALTPPPVPALIKTVEPAPQKEDVYRRVAKFLLLIGIDEAAKVIAHLDESQTEKIIPQIASIRRVESGEAEEILSEFRSLLERSRETGGVNAARAMLQKAFGESKAETLIRNAVPFPSGEPFDYLSEYDGERLNLLLHDESVEVSALVLSRLKPALSAAAIARMESARKTAVIKRLAKMGAVSPEVIKAVDARLHEKSLRTNAERSDKVDGAEALAEILRRMDMRGEQEILSSLERGDPALADRLREKLFTADDVLSADDKYIQAELREMRDEDVVLLIAGKGGEFREKILRNMSKGRGDRLLEDEQLKKPFRRADVDAATAEFFSRLRAAWQKGNLAVAGREGDEWVT
jgi:flagellar motor switch protein FliG